MFIVKWTAQLGLGFTVGCAATWAADDSLITEIRERVGLTPYPDADYLKQTIVATDLDLSGKREKFTQMLKEKGPSLPFSIIISEFNRKAFQIRAEKDLDSLSRNEELDVLEALLRKQYPELFDEKPGKDFIASLDVKLYCNDHYQVPKFLRPVR